MNSHIPNRFSSERRFELWEYRGFHWQFLLRSQPDKTHPFNIDITFSGVSYIQVELGFHGLEIQRVTVEEETSFREKRNLFRSQILIKIHSQTLDYFLVCNGFNVYKNTLDLSKSPLVSFEDDDQLSVESFGELLAADSSHRSEAASS